MLEGKRIAVVVPAYNEERLIVRTLTTMPEFVDRVFVVNDGSKDATAERIRECAAGDPRIVLIDHGTNRGLGQALITGYVAARDSDAEIVAIMAGDAQMAPADLASVVGPIVAGHADYVKGNRLLRHDVVERMPFYRFVGNNILTLLTKFATGYWRIIDPQCGYTAISTSALRRIPIEEMIKGYGYNAHILHMLNLANFRVVDVEVEPVYRDEVSKIKLKSYVWNVSRLLIRLTVRRVFRKYLLRQFHPLVFFYLFAVFQGLVLTPILLARFLYLYFSLGEAPQTTLILLTFCSSLAFFSLFFAMWMDMEDNRSLEGQPN
jgi:glycosyltransferase involved in cell wall biosynthesis